MKKLISFVLWAFLALGIFWFSFSDSVLDYLDNIWGDILFWYSATNKISVDSINSTSVTIKSPILEDEFDDVIDNYTLMYGEYPLVKVLDNPTLLDHSKEKIFSNLNLWVNSTFNMKLTSSDNINPSTIYYLVSIPKDSAGTLWEISNELCFRLSDQLVGQWDECSNWSASLHWAWADMSLANISHHLNWNMLTLKWINVSGSDKVDIFLWNESSATFSKLSTVNMSAESYSFTVTRNWEHIIKFIPNNWGKEINYTFNVLWLSDSINPTPVTPTVTPVVVWPKENILAVLIWTIVLYLGYRLLKRKA